jgi:hypothetical protein
VTVDFSELKAALVARGFNRLTSALQGEYVNAAVTEVDGLYPWPYREDSTAGIAPLSIPTLGEIEAVTDETRQVALEVVQYRNLLDWFGDLSVTGDPQYAYVAWPGGVPAVATFPVTSNTVGVQFWQAPTTLSLDADEPLAPARFHYVYVAVACRMAAADSGGDPARFAGEADRGVQGMMLALLPDQLDGQVQRVDYGSAADW